MIAINKAEKQAVSAQFPNAHIVRTMKQKSKRHHYYCEETKKIMKFLNNMRESISAMNQKVGAEN